MPNDSVLAHLVFGRGVGLKPEDATTEAIVYVLNRSEPVRRRFDQLVSAATGLSLAPVQRYETQVQQAQNQRPDIVGYSETNQQILLIENKFWADLTVNQPVAYINVLASNEPGLVLFVCPSTRIDLLWAYLLDRVKKAGIGIVNSTQNNDTRSILLKGGYHALGCISWNRLLSDLRQAAQNAVDATTVCDLEQISGLVAQVDANNPFLPLRDENLFQSQGRIFLSFKEIDELLRPRIASISQYHPVRSDYTWLNCSVANSAAKIRWFEVCLNLKMWARWGYSPFWITIGPWDNNPSYSHIKSAVAGWLNEGPHRAVEGGSTSKPFIAVPVIPPCGVERDVVVEKLSDEVIKIIAFIENNLCSILNNSCPTKANP